MGGFKEYVPSGGFSQYLYHQVGETICASNGVQGKIIDKNEESDSVYHSGLPTYSNTSEVYFKLSDESKEVEQARIYKDRQPYIDFDWDHHEIDLVHVHEWHFNEKRMKWIRSKGRPMNDTEIDRYGELLLLANPKIRFS